MNFDQVAMFWCRSQNFEENALETLLSTDASRSVVFRFTTAIEETSVPGVHELWTAQYPEISLALKALFVGGLARTT